MAHFTNDNTDGYSSRDLAVLNERFEDAIYLPVDALAAMSEIEIKSWHDHQVRVGPGRFRTSPPNGRAERCPTTILFGYTSPMTAFVVEDYPYGFRLRCSIRYWLETSSTHGVRLMTQTSNPKRGNVWNKAKASDLRGALRWGVVFLDENGHVQWNGLN